MDLKTQLESLNNYTRRNFTEEEVYLFPVHLCDNEIDRDGERFSLSALTQLKKLFVGKTGIFDHNPKGEHQTARIYATELVTDVSRETSAGEPYTYLKGYAYMVRTEKNRDLILEIDGGIKKEVSVSCSAKSQCCSICGCDRRTHPCVHQVGAVYDGVMCHVVLSEILDAYEWSFVAIPAQREAGITKQYADDLSTRKQITHLEKELRQAKALIRELDEEVCKEIVRLRFLVEGVTKEDAVSKAVKRMDLTERIAFRESLRKQLKKSCPGQLSTPEEHKTMPSENRAFQI